MKRREKNSKWCVYFNNENAMRLQGIYLVCIDSALWKECKHQIVFSLFVICRLESKMLVQSSGVLCL